VNGDYRSQRSKVNDTRETKGGQFSSTPRPKSPDVDYSVNWSRIDTGTRNTGNL